MMNRAEGRLVGVTTFEGETSAKLRIESTPISLFYDVTRISARNAPTAARRHQSRKSVIAPYRKLFLAALLDCRCSSSSDEGLRELAATGFSKRFGGRTERVSPAIDSGSLLGYADTDVSARPDWI
jgi:hypothetical protein